MSEVRHLAEMKAKFSEMVDQVERHHNRIVVTRNGRPAAVLMMVELADAWWHSFGSLACDRLFAAAGLHPSAWADDED